MPVHQCPVCRAAHEVHPVLHDLAYGRQLTCSPRCKTDWPALILAGLQTDKRNDGAYSNGSGKDKETAC